MVYYFPLWWSFWISINLSCLYPWQRSYVCFYLYCRCLLQFLMLLLVMFEELSIYDLVPCIRNTREAPMAAILVSQKWYSLLLCQILLPVNWWMGINPEITHSCNVQIEDWKLHPPHYWLKNPQHTWIFWQICLILNWHSLVITLPTRIPSSTSVNGQKENEEATSSLIIEL